MESRVFEGYGGVTLAATAFGSPQDPPVLLVPSHGQTREFWFGSAEALADAGRYAICIDLRGHGDSGHSPDGHYGLDSHVADLRAILAALPSRAFVVAAGFGALVTIAAVGEGAPHLVSGLALVDANIWFERAIVEQMARAIKRRTTEFENETMIADAIAATYPTEPRQPLTERVLAAYTRRPDGRYAWRGDPRALDFGPVEDMEARLAAAASAIAAPATLIRGSLNATVSEASIRKLQEMVRGSEVAEIEGVGHYVAADREDMFNAILLDFLERHAPRQPLTYLSGSEARILRDALGCFGTGVTIVTTLDENGEPLGLTANSFTSVSLDPPLILFSLARKSANLEAFEKAGHFAVNVLHIGQQPVAGKFAQRDVARFDGIDWAAQPGGSPILAGSLASFDCNTFAVHDGGDHLIFIGEVKHAWFEPHRDPLLYFRGRFRRLHFA
jgi:flavin reductase (DIM6/NTAB) family NADH-FMN oxidoreductase RutF/pimeloyl-ACP methyl ester carboxylesterase